MSNLIVVIDPNDENLNELVAETNALKPKNVWVGCSTSPAEEFLDIFRDLENPADLYPGTLDQIRNLYSLARNVYVSDPLFYSNPEINSLFREVLRYSEDRFPEKRCLMDFVLLHPNCSVARILGVTESYNDAYVLEALGNKEVHPRIYLEGGSRNKKSSITDRLDLVEEMKRRYPKKKIICGGGISTLEQIKMLRDLDSDVVISNLVHKNPKMLRSCMDLFE